MKIGRPTAYKEDFAQQAEKLAALGATDMELADFFEMMPSEDDWLLVCLTLIRQDRSGVVADQKKARANRRRKSRDENPSLRVRKSVLARMWAALKNLCPLWAAENVRKGASYVPA